MSSSVVSGVVSSRICPKCGSPFSYIEKRKKGTKEYLYAVHVSRISGKRHVKKCYLGPLSTTPQATPQTQLTPQLTPQETPHIVVLSKSDLEAILLYYGKRVKCPESVRKRAKQLFEQIFSPGRKTLIIES